MALYLGKNKISPNMTTIIEKTTTIVKDTNDQVISETTNQTIDSNYTISDPNLVATDYLDIEEWVYPLDWPDLEQIPLDDDFEGAYLLYDNRLEPHWATFYCTNTGGYWVTAGHLNENHEFVADLETISAGNNAYVNCDYSSLNTDYVVIQIIPKDAAKHFTTWYFGRVAIAQTENITTTLQYQQNCIARRAQLPYVSSTAGSGDNYRFATDKLLYDHLSIGTKAASISLAAAWYRARMLKKLILDNTASMKVTNLSSVFEQCNEIENLDFSNWDTSGWAVTTLKNAFYECRRLRNINMTWHTNSWRVTTLEAAFYGCRALTELDLSSWDTSNWTITTLSSVWYNCLSLRKLNITNWDTENWKVTTLYSAWYGCQQLFDVDLSKWKTGNWPLISFSATWYGNHNRRNFSDIEQWDTSNWAITTFANAFYYCRKVSSINLSHWATYNRTTGDDIGTNSVSLWRPTTMTAMFKGCENLQRAIFNWGSLTEDWVVTNLSEVFNACYKLVYTDIFNLHTDNWAVTTMASMFANCWELQSIDLTNWDTTNFALTTMTSFSLYCYHLHTLKISNLDVTNITAANWGNATTSNFIYCCYALEVLRLPATFHGNTSLRYCYQLPASEIVNMFNTIAPASGTTTINIGEQRYKLKTADVNIVNTTTGGKGYTVS